MPTQVCLPKQASTCVAPPVQPSTPAVSECDEVVARVHKGLWQKERGLKGFSERR
jgi:hypothetical protein